MLTNLQEGSMQEFREKEGKWFSQIKGVTTEWLDDGKAGNIDTREFSYQGIDEADDITVTSGGYTSYDCSPCLGWNGVYGLSNPLAQNNSGEVFTPPGQQTASYYEEVLNWFFQSGNTTKRFYDYYHTILGTPANNTSNIYAINGVDFTDGFYGGIDNISYLPAVSYSGVNYSIPGPPVPSTLIPIVTATFETAEEAINYFATHYNTATYGNPNFRAGMSFAEFKDKAFSLAPVATYSSGNLTGHRYIQPLDSAPDAFVLKRIS